MITVTVTDFRQKAKYYLDAVEKGETVRILRHGKATVDVVPLRQDEKKTSFWKTSGLAAKDQI